MVNAILLCLAVYRLSRLIAIDEFPPMMLFRARVAERWGDKSWQAYLSECPWCVSMWIGAPIVLVTALLSSLPVPPLVWFVASAVTGLVHNLDALVTASEDAAKKFSSEG